MLIDFPGCSLVHAWHCLLTYVLNGPVQRLEFVGAVRRYAQKSHIVVPAKVNCWNKQMRHMIVQD